MANLNANRTAQWLLVSSFTFDVANGDLMQNAAGAIVKIGGVAGAQVFDAVKLPKGTRILGGGVSVLTAGNDTGAQTVAIGDATNPTRYLAATSIKTAARTDLTASGFTGAGEPLRISLANGNGDGTAGKVQVDIQFIIDGRANEVVQPAA